MDVEKRRLGWFSIIAALVILAIAAEKCRQLVGDDSVSKSGKFVWLNCFDMSSGTLACLAKEGGKLYVYNLRAGHVERERRKAIEIALREAITGGLSVEVASKQAQQAGVKAAKLASKKAKRITGPIMAAGWDFFEALYYGGTIIEGFLRGIGTLFGTYGGGFYGEQRLGRVGYLIGSHVGNWFGGRVGLMVYDVINGVQYLLYTASSVASDVLSGEIINDSSETSYQSPETFEEIPETMKDMYESESIGENQEEIPETTRDMYESESMGENQETDYEDALEV
ncbi:hypothetical protein SUGI_1051570 [Cryptomeria japonica]|uniref:uncharacterized protein LOC131039412 n=1 Tax=Cryptomeria japonica TaxID=3369 RepID=UPI00241479C5|nr:uncharacterized protein LOC131039412 [Cryptomeria japonica]GLJ49579.1 hypothetical protein SUGI_1051570 [Cryptomeria japonica]